MPSLFCYDHHILKSLWIIISEVIQVYLLCYNDSDATWVIDHSGGLQEVEKSKARMSSRQTNESKRVFDQNNHFQETEIFSTKNHVKKFGFLKMIILIKYTLASVCLPTDHSCLWFFCFLKSTRPFHRKKFMKSRTKKKLSVF